PIFASMPKLTPVRTELIWEGKYDEHGNRRPISLPDTPLPLQKVERIDLPRDIEKARQPSLFDEQDFQKQHHYDSWHNRLIWGDNKLVMHSLLTELRGQIDLIYIDPPFDVGADFTVDIPIGEGNDTIEKEQSLLEAVAYRDIWGKGTDSYLHYMYERFVLMKELLSERGNIVVHVDYRVTHYLRLIMDEIFGRDRIVNEIIWHYRSGGGSEGHFGRKHDTLLYYSKSDKYIFNSDIPEARVPHDAVIAESRKHLFDPRGKIRPDVWDVGRPPNHSKEWVGFPTQKPMALLEIIISVLSPQDGIVADFFCGSGTTLAVAEKLGRRWIGVDIGRYAIHVSRKRLIEVQKQLYQEGKKYRPFAVYNLGRYERQWWQREKLRDADAEHRRIVLHFYQARPLDPPPHPLLHGQKEGAYVHVVEVDAFLSCPRLKELAEALRLVGGKALHVLAWDFDRIQDGYKTYFFLPHRITYS
ncbi:MAG: site-specific DNA-methyltransferase, partial [Bacteroidia bacterium]|nr:site-specific DNA-methyltransferase [Bacteroidia bacterium]